MEVDRAFFRRVKDIRGYLDELDGNPSNWRLRLRRELFEERKGRSDLTQRVLFDSFDMHEGIFSRRWVGKQNWQALLYSSVNCFLLRMEEHRIETPDRITCYWISVCRHDKLTVDTWIQSLPFKVRPDTPWSGSNGYDIIAAIPNKYAVSGEWQSWFDKHKRTLDTEA